MSKFRFVAPCHFGLEKTLSFEIKKAGGEDIAVTDGRVCFSGDEAVCARANIFSRTAERISIILGEFRAETFDELFEGIKKLPLSDYIGRNDAFPNNGHSLNSKLTSVPACQKIVKKAMAVNLGKAYGVNVLPEDGAERKIRFSLMKNMFTLTLDTSGAGLHKRGYRRESNAAPIRETLAAGIVDIARVHAGDTVVDPFCGSGTILIESAMKALGIAPGLNRHFSGENLPFIPKSVWKEAREEARSLIKTDADFTGIGSDIDESCVELTMQNAKIAGVERYIHVEKRDIRDLVLSENPVKIITNPPYGERMLELSEARELYGIMGSRILPLGENSLYVITPDEEFESVFGLKSTKNRKLYNGMMKARLYIYRSPLKTSFE